MSSNSNYIPIIDFSKYLNGTDEEKRQCGMEIGNACENVGFFIVKGHGVNKEIIDNTWNATWNFFDLPVEEKMKYLTTDEAKYPFGYSGMGMEVLSAGKDKETSKVNTAPPDLKELFSLGPSNPKSGFPERIFPKNPENFKSSYTLYYEELVKLADKILEAMTIPLNLEKDYFKQFTTHHASALRTLNYPALPPGHKHVEGQMRASAHTDYGTITILRSGGPGLQVCKDINNSSEGNSWEDAPYLPDDDVFVINLGDLMRRWTNDKYCSTLHRVLPCPDRRQSMAFFHNLNRDAVVSNLTSEPSKYKDIKAGDFLMEKHLASVSHSPTIVKK